MDKKIIVTTGDLKEDYEVLGPVYFQVSNKGLFGSALGNYKKQYMDEIQAMKRKGTMSQERADWGFLYGEWSVGQNDFEAAFFIATEELKKRAKMVGADAVICMRQDIDMDTNGFAFFYLQMYGTAVKLKNNTSNESPSVQTDFYGTQENSLMNADSGNIDESLEIVQYCINCNHIYGGTCGMNCPVCKLPLTATNILVEDWKKYSPDEKKRYKGAFSRGEYLRKR